MTSYNLHKILREELKNGSSNLVTRQSGQAIRERIERDMEREKAGEVVTLDFSKIGVIDYSCADEIVAKLISRLLGDEYGDRYIVLTGLNENQRENIEVALERKDLAALARMRDGSRVLIGRLNNYLQKTLDLVLKKGKLSSGELSHMLKLPPKTSGNRLLNLHKKRLVKRMGEMRNGGRVWVYEKV